MKAVNLIFLDKWGRITTQQTAFIITSSTDANSYHLDNAALFLIIGLTQTKVTTRRPCAKRLIILPVLNFIFLPHSPGSACQSADHRGDAVQGHHRLHGPHPQGAGLHLLLER